MEDAIMLFTQFHEDGSATLGLSYPRRVKRFLERYPPQHYSLTTEVSELGALVLIRAQVRECNRDHVIADGAAVWNPISDPGRYGAFESVAKGRAMRALGIYDDDELDPVFPEFQESESGFDHRSTLTASGGVDLEDPTELPASLVDHDGDDHQRRHTTEEPDDTEQPVESEPDVESPTPAPEAPPDPDSATESDPDAFAVPDPTPTESPDSQGEGSEPLASPSDEDPTSGLSSRRKRLKTDHKPPTPRMLAELEDLFSQVGDELPPIPNRGAARALKKDLLNRIASGC
ncbi:MAG: hypothetical protein AAGB14_11630 [Verrucomicrobiota bacterium]